MRGESNEDMMSIEIKPTPNWSGRLSRLPVDHNGLS